MFHRLVGNLSAVIAALCACAPAQAQEDTLQVVPASGWTLDYADDSCALRRNFSSGENVVYLEMRQYSPFSQLRITVASERLSVRQRNPRFRFGSEGPLQIYDLPAYGSYGEGVSGLSFYGSVVMEGIFAEGEILSTEQYSARLEQLEAGISGLHLENAFNHPILLQTGYLGAPMRALRECMTDLVASWGAGTYLADPGSTPAEEVDQARWARQIQARFPISLLGRREPAVVVMRLLIDSAGVTTGCRIQQPVVDEDYEGFVCGVAMEGARHNPARDAAGNPIASFRIVTIQYDGS